MRTMMTTRMTMTIEVLDKSDLRVDELDKLKFSLLRELAETLIHYIENGMRIVEILEKDTDVKTKMIRVGITNAATLLRDVSTAYENRVQEGK